MTDLFLLWQAEEVTYQYTWRRMTAKHADHAFLATTRVLDRLSHQCQQSWSRAGKTRVLFFVSNVSSSEENDMQNRIYIGEYLNRCLILCDQLPSLLGYTPCERLGCGSVAVPSTEWGGEHSHGCWFVNIISDDKLFAFQLKCAWINNEC